MYARGRAKPRAVRGHRRVAVKSQRLTADYNAGQVHVKAKRALGGTIGHAGARTCAKLSDRPTKRRPTEQPTDAVTFFVNLNVPANQSTFRTSLSQTGAIRFFD